MVKKLIYIVLLVSVCIGCERNAYTPVPSRDWAGTTYLFGSTDEQQAFTYYKPYVGYVGDPMPFFDPVSRQFMVSYLQDYRPNPVGTYHPIWCVQTSDAAHYQSIGEIIPCGHIDAQDAALGTGSVIYNAQDNLYYFFYTGHKYELEPGDCREAVHVATSSDFRTWQKDTSFVLYGKDYGYAMHDFRDPFVLYDQGVYHLIVATRKEAKGVFADFVSSDLKHWTHNGVFMEMMWDRFYECPDFFQMGEWWYLVYSDQTINRQVQYFKARSLDELKACTRDDAGRWPDDKEGMLDSKGFYAGKTASDGVNRYIWGWCPTRNGRDNTATGGGKTSTEWSGNLVAHRLVQHADGTLSLGEVPAIKSRFAESVSPTPMRRQGAIAQYDGLWTLQAGSNILFNRLQYHNHIHCKVTTGGQSDRFGFSFVRGTSYVSQADSSVYYTVMINPEGNDRRKINLEQEGENGKGFIGNADSYFFPRPEDNTYVVDIYTDNSIIVVYINDNVCWTGRLYGIQRNCWSVNCYTGTVYLKDLQISTYY